MQNHPDGFFVSTDLFPSLGGVTDLHYVPAAFLNRVDVTTRDIDVVEILPDEFQVAIGGFIDPDLTMALIERANQFGCFVELGNDLPGLLLGVSHGLGALLCPGVARCVDFFRAIQSAPCGEVVYDFVRPFPDSQRRMRHDGLDLFPDRVGSALLHRHDKPAEYSDGARPIQVGSAPAPHEIHPRPGHSFKLRIIFR